MSEVTTAGTEVAKMAPTETITSNIPPRHHAARMPRNVPRVKLMIVAVPIRPTVQISAWPRTEVTGSGKYLIERPRSPVKMLCR